MDYRCLICGKQFTRRGRGIAKTCSRICGGKYHGQISLGKKLKNRKGVTKNCIVCKKEFYCWPAQVERRVTCSRDCRYNYGWVNRMNVLYHKRIDSKGYVYVYAKNHPNCNSSGAMAEHRLVMEKYLGRYLTKDEQVHHKNGIKSDNRLSNLEVVMSRMHFGKVQCPHCQKKFKVK